jgi:hypothetical protein
MARLLLILVAVALVIWIGERYYVAHPGTVDFWGWFGSKMETTPAPAPAAGASPSATPEHTLAACRAALWAQSQNLLRPLDQNKDFSPVKTTGILRDTQRELVQYRRDPDYNRLVQACNVLSQVLQERESYLDRYQKAAAASASSSSSKLQTSTLQPSHDLQPLSPDDSNAFFKQRVQTEWRERCSYYEPIIDGLLTGAH